MDRKEEIIHAALELASEKGLRAVSVAQIAERVGIKAPSLYNHFRSKEEIVRGMYSLLREKAREGSSTGLERMDALASGNLEESLTAAVSGYVGMVTQGRMLQFFRVLYSERSTDPVAAEIILEETDRMIRATRSLFYALAVHGRMKSEGIDTAAMAFALTVHGLIDCRMDRITAGRAERFGDGEGPLTEELTGFIRWFCAQAGGERE